jgi:glycosyltransferase involved in cell wall biosynthesis
MFPPGDFARLSWTLDRADVISAVSNDLARKIAVMLGRDPDVQVVHNSVDVDTFSPGPTDTELRKSLGIATQETVLGFCGELRHKKGLPFLLEALAEVRRRRPACLLVIGEVRAREQALLSSHLAQDPTRGERLILTGQIEDQRDVARHLRLCDVFLHPSVWDGLPNALLEAMACGRLVIASDAGGIPEAIEHQVSGFVVPRAHLHRLGEAILDVLSLSDEQRNRIGLEARRRVVERFQDEHEAAGLREILSRLETRRRGHKNVYLYIWGHIFGVRP